MSKDGSEYDAVRTADEPAHVVSSLLVHDYLTQGLGQNPLNFARSYYAHFPKVAIGRWPPLFHGTEALWMLVFGRSKRAMLAWLTVLVVKLRCARAAVSQ
jgi:hypothetical protein